MTVHPGRLILHPNYRQFITLSANDDVALIRTRTSLEMDNGLGLSYPISLATREATKGIVIVSGSTGVIVDSPTNQDKSVRHFCKIQVPIESSEASYPKYLLSDMFCVVDENRNSSRPGYSAGSAVQHGKLVGLVCAGKECDKPGRQGLYTNVVKYGSWINEQIELVEKESQAESTWLTVS